MVKTELNQLYDAVEIVEGLGITRERVKQLKGSLLSQMRVLSIFFQIVSIAIITIQKHKLVAPSIFDRGDGVTEVMVEYVTSYTVYI